MSLKFSAVGATIGALILTCFRSAGRAFLTVEGSRAGSLIWPEIKRSIVAATAASSLAAGVAVFAESIASDTNLITAAGSILQTALSAHGLGLIAPYAGPLLAFILTRMAAEAAFYAKGHPAPIAAPAPAPKLSAEGPPGSVPTSPPAPTVLPRLQPLGVMVGFIDRSIDPEKFAKEIPKQFPLCVSATSPISNSTLVCFPLYDAEPAPLPTSPPASGDSPAGFIRIFFRFGIRQADRDRLQAQLTERFDGVYHVSPEGVTTRLDVKNRNSSDFPDLFRDAAKIRGMVGDAEVDVVGPDGLVYS